MSVPNLSRNKMSVTVSSQWFVKQQLYKQEKKRIIAHRHTKQIRRNKSPLQVSKLNKKRKRKENADKEETNICKRRSTTIMLNFVPLRPKLSHWSDFCYWLQARTELQTQLWAHTDTHPIWLLWQGKKPNNALPQCKNQDGKRALPPHKKRNSLQCSTLPRSTHYAPQRYNFLIALKHCGKWGKKKE